MANTLRILSCYNSSTVALAAGATWTGTWEDVLDYRTITTYVATDVDSAAGGLQLYFSSSATGATTESIAKYTNYGGQQEYSVPAGARYFRIVYVNGSTDQSTFNLKTYLIRDGQPVSEPVQFSPGQLELFGRIRVAEPATILDIKHLYTFNNLQMDQYISGSGTITYNSNASTVALAVSGVGTAIIQSRLYCQYQPGKSLLIYATGILNNGGPNATTSTARIGYFDESNGPFFEYSNGVPKIVLRSVSSGSISDNVIAQTNWNIDKLDGSGISRVLVDWSKALIYAINVAWLGVGQIIMGVIWGGQFYPAHIFRHTSLTTTYMGSPNLPIRYELSATSGNASLLSICASVASEGGYSLSGIPFSVILGPAKTVSATETYLFAVRLKNLRRTIIKLLSASFLSASTGDYIFRVYSVLSPSTVPITGAGLTWLSVNTNSAMEYNIDGTGATLTNAILVFQEFISDTSKALRVLLRQDSESVYITAGINQGTFYSDYVICTAQRTTAGTKDVQASLTWTETF
jgi:hypothetical protein